MRSYIFIGFILVLSIGQLAASIRLNVIEKKIEVQGKEALIYSIEQPSGKQGIEINQSQPFDVSLLNSLTVPTSIHWHGLILPYQFDGAAFVTQYPIYPGVSYAYQFPLLQAGTFWMHSHYGLQQQRLLAAPLIIHSPEDAQIANQEAVILLADFSFQSPSEIFETLQCGGRNMNMDVPDIVEVNYDAFLTNLRTLENPEIIAVKPDTRVRLRIINGASATNFFISLGKLTGEVIAVDGNKIEPFKGDRFELAIGQRIDIIIVVPTKGGTFPILMQGEGTNKRTGAILSTEKGPFPQLSSQAQEKVGPLTNCQEFCLKALSPLPRKPVNQKILMTLGGDMATYVWTLNDQAWPEVTPIIVKKGDRISITFINESPMAHPMHLHGHTFQVTAIDGQSLQGAMRDTILVAPKSTVTIEFDADNPGVWPIHCHMLYHMAAGMFTVIRYKGFVQPL